MNDAFPLPGRLDTAAAPAIAAALKDKRGAPADIDGSAVTFAGALGLQVLVSARRDWVSDGQGFRIVGPSAALTAACRQLGISDDDIGLADSEEG